MKPAAVLWIAACAALAGPSSTRCAAEVQVRIPVSYRSWQFSDSSASVTAKQWVAPLTVSLDLTQDVKLLLQGAAQSGTLDAGASSRLSGATDSRAALRWSPAGGRLLLQAGLNIPTGTRELDEEQERVALALSPPFLGYRVRQTGRGLDAGGGVTLALPLSERWALGVGGSYLHRGSFRAVKNGAEVQPGAEITASAGIDGDLIGMRIRADGTRRVYGRDQGNGADYKEPAVSEGSLAAGADGSAWGFSSALLFSHKEKAETGSSPFSGNYLGGSVEVHRGLGSRFRIGAGGEIVRFRSAGSGSGAFESTTGGGGPSFVIFLGERTRIEGQLKKLKGTLKPGGADSESIDGWDAALALSLTGGSRDR